MSSTVDQFPNDRPPTPLDAMRAAERRRQQAQERADPEPQTLPTEETVRSLAQVSREFPPAVDTPLFDFADFDETDSPEVEQHQSGYEWLAASFGTEWWRGMGFDSDLQPAQAEVVIRIIAMLDLKVELNLVSVILNQWLNGDDPKAIADMVFTGLKAVENYIRTAKAKISAYAEVFSMPTPQVKESEVVEEDTQTLGRERIPYRVKGIVWLTDTFGPEWWHTLGFEGNEQPINEEVANAILGLFVQRSDAPLRLPVIIGWLNGNTPAEIASQYTGRISGQKVANMLFHVRTVITNHAAGPRKRREIAPLVKPTARVEGWLENTYGKAWWKSLGFTSKRRVDVDIIISALADRLGINNDDPSWTYLTGWIHGKSREEMATETGKTRPYVSSQVEMMMNVLEGVEEVMNPKQREQKIGGPAVKSTTTPPMHVPAEASAEKRSMPALRLTNDWAERLQFNEHYRTELGQFFNPNGSVIMNRDAYNAFQKLKDYVQQEFETFDDERLEDLNDHQRSALREITGLDRRVQDERVETSQTPRYQTVSRFLRDYSHRAYDYAKPEDLAVEVLKGFRILLEASTPQQAQQEAK